VDAHGIPLALELTPANVHDSTVLEPVLDAVPPVRQCIGRPRKRPGKLHADKALDFSRYRRACRKRCIVPRIARSGVDSSERLGRHRWVVDAPWLGSPASAGSVSATNGGPTSSRRSTASPPP